MGDDAGPLPATQNFAAWADRVGRGDADAEESVVMFFRPRVFVFAERKLRDPAVADEIVQEALWAVIRMLRERSVNAPEHLPALVYSIAQKKIADYQRSAARRPVAPWPRDFDPPASATESQFDDERRALADQAIQQLDPADRTILGMLLREGLEAASIAERLGISAEAVRQRKSRALRRVAEKLREIATPPSQRVTRERLYRGRG